MLRVFATLGLRLKLVEEELAKQRTVHLSVSDRQYGRAGGVSNSILLSVLFGGKQEQKNSDQLCVPGPPD